MFINMVIRWSHVEHMLISFSVYSFSLFLWRLLIQHVSHTMYVLPKFEKKKPLIFYFKFIVDAV